MKTFQSSLYTFARLVLGKNATPAEYMQHIEETENHVRLFVASTIGFESTAQDICCIADMTSNVAYCWVDSPFGQDDLETLSVLEDHMREGPWLEAFQRVSQNYVQCQPSTDADLYLVKVALEVRLLLNVIAADVLLPAMYNTLDRIDMAIEPYACALGALTADKYFDATDPTKIVQFYSSDWVGWRYRRDQEEAKKLALLHAKKNVLT